MGHGRDMLKQLFVSGILLLAGVFCQQEAQDLIQQAFRSTGIPSDGCEPGTCLTGLNYAWDNTFFYTDPPDENAYVTPVATAEECCSFCSQLDTFCLFWDYLPETQACRRFTIDDYFQNFFLLGNPAPVKKQEGAILGIVLQRVFEDKEVTGEASYVLQFDSLPDYNCRGFSGKQCLARACATSCESSPNCKFWDVDLVSNVCSLYKADADGLDSAFAFRSRESKIAGISFGRNLAFTFEKVDILWSGAQQLLVNTTSLSTVTQASAGVESNGVEGYNWGYSLSMELPAFQDSGLGTETGPLVLPVLKTGAPEPLAAAPGFQSLESWQLDLQGYKTTVNQTVSSDQSQNRLPLTEPLTGLPEEGFFTLNYQLSTANLMAVPANVTVVYQVMPASLDPLDAALSVSDLMRRAGLCDVPGMEEALTAEEPFELGILSEMNFYGLPLEVLNVTVDTTNTGTCYPIEGQEINDGLEGKYTITPPHIVPSWQDCCAECSTDTACVAWSFRAERLGGCTTLDCVENRCLLFNAVERVNKSMEAYKGVYSGLVLPGAKEMEQFPGVELLAVEGAVSPASTPAVCWQMCSSDTSCRGYTFYINGTCSLARGEITGSRQAFDATSGLQHSILTTRDVTSASCTPTAVLMPSQSSLVSVLQLSRAPKLSWREVCCFNNLPNCSVISSGNDTAATTVVLPCPGTAPTSCPAVDGVRADCAEMPGLSLNAPLTAQLNNGLRTVTANASECCALCYLTPKCVASSHVPSTGGSCFLLSNFTGAVVAQSESTTSAVNLAVWNATCPYAPTFTLKAGQTVSANLDSSVTNHVSWQTVCCANPGIRNCRESLAMDYVLYIPCYNGNEQCEGTEEDHNYTVAIALGTGAAVAILMSILGCCIAGWWSRRKHQREMRELNYDEAAFLIASDEKSGSFDSLMGDGSRKGLQSEKYSWSGERWKGGNCVVVLGVNAATGKEVVAKTFKEESVFLHEKEMHTMGYAAGCVPEVYEMFDGDAITPPCIVMEAGRYNLASLFNRGVRQSSLHQRATMKNVCDAVGALHSHAIAHLAINPQNVMWFDGTHKWKLLHLTQWAMARNQVRMEDLDIRYCAPEVARAIVGDGMFNCRLPADLWSIGVIGWELYTGSKLFGSEYSDQDVVEMLIGDRLLPFESDPKLWRKIQDEQVLELLEHLLCRLPPERWTIQRVLDHPLFKTQHDDVMKAARLGGVAEKLRHLADEVKALEEVSLQSLRQSATTGLFVSISFEKLSPNQNFEEMDTKSLRTVSAKSMDADFYDPIDDLDEISNMLHKLVDEEGVSDYCDYFLGKYDIEEAPVNLIASLAEAEEPEVLVQAKAKYAVKFSIMCGTETVVELPIEGVTFLVVMDEDASLDAPTDSVAGLPVVPLSEENSRTAWNGFAMWNTHMLKPGKCRLQFCAAVKLKAGEEVKIRKMMSLNVTNLANEVYLHKAATQVADMWNNAPEWMKLTVHGVNMLFDMHDMVSAVL